jgi:hypothetical protein
MSFSSFFKSVGAWFKGFNSKHNWTQVAHVVEDAGEVATATLTKNAPAGIQAGVQLASDAKAIKVEGDFPWNSASAASKTEPDATGDSTHSTEASHGTTGGAK